jgi:ribosomal protein S18 acetylase RimI-like enzyme
MTVPDSGTSIVQLTPDSIDRCWALRLRALREHPEAFGQPYAEAVLLTPDEVRERATTTWLRGDNRVFVAESADGALVGMLGVARESGERERHRAFVWGVYVAPEARSQGIAGRLLAAAIDWCRALDGVLQVHLSVAANNAPAITVYRQAGFAWCGRTPRVWILDGQVLDQDHMVLMLDGYPLDLDTQRKGSPA